MRPCIEKINRGFAAGGVTIKPGIILAPVDGVFDRPCREVYREYPFGLTVCEMVDARGACRTLEHCRVKLLPAPNERPYCVQLVGFQPDAFAKAAEKILSEIGGVDMFDINMGCPQRRVSASNSGVALMKYPDNAAKIVEAVKRASGLPVSVKTRAGISAEKVGALDLALACEAAGACMITVHGRTKEQLFSGKVNFDSIAQAVEAVKIPVVGNGGINSPDDAVEMMEKTGCAGVMLATGAFGAPWLAGQIASDDASPPPINRRFDLMRRHLRLAIDYYGERGLFKMRKHLAWYLSGLPYACETKARIMALTADKDVYDLLDDYEGFLAERAGD